LSYKQVQAKELGCEKRILAKIQELLKDLLNEEEGYFGGEGTLDTPSSSDSN